MVKSKVASDGRLIRPLIVVGSGMLAVIVAIVLNMVVSDRSPPVPEAVPAAVPSSPASSAVPAAVPPSMPVAPPAAGASFDVVRVEPSGAAVIAGRGEPLARITIRSGETAVGQGQVDERGEWIVMPSQPLSPGTHELTVEMLRADGSTTIGDDLVVIVVPPPPVAGETATLPLAVKASRSGSSPSTVLQSVGGDPAAPLAIEAIDGGADRRLTISGRAAPHSRLRLYLDNALLGEATADSLGLWRFAPPAPIGDGEHSLRADAITARGEVLARVRVPLRINGGSAAVLPPRSHDGRVVVERGDSLWRIARVMYGEGTAYTIIYDANRHQIQDPDLIYPGQVFQLPTAQ